MVTVEDSGVRHALGVCEELAEINCVSGGKVAESAGVDMTEWRQFVNMFNTVLVYFIVVSTCNGMLPCTPK